MLRNAVLAETEGNNLNVHAWATNLKSRTNRLTAVANEARGRVSASY